MRSVGVVVVAQRAVVHHGTDVRMRVIVCAVLVRIGVEEDAQAIELVLVPEHIARSERIFHVPERHSVAEQILTVAIDLELDYDLPISELNRLFGVRASDGGV